MQKNKKDVRNKGRKKAEIWCDSSVSTWDSNHPCTQSEEVVVMSEGVTVLFVPSPQALHCLKEGVHPTAWSVEQGASSPPRLCST